MSVVDVRMPPINTDEGLRAAIAARSRLPGAASCHSSAVRRSIAALAAALLLLFLLHQGYG